MNHRITALGFALAVATLGLTHPNETAAAIFVPPPPVAGSLANGGLACYVDTFADDPLTRNYCGAVWSRKTGNVRTIAHFEVVGLDVGYPYTFTWSRAGCGTSSHCDLAITASPEQLITLSVTVRNQLGQSKTFTAQAEYIDGSR